MDGKCFGDDNPRKWDAENLNPLSPEVEAASLCRGCPVMSECYRDALEKFSTARYAGVYEEVDAELGTEGVVRAGRVW